MEAEKLQKGIAQKEIVGAFYEQFGNILNIGVLCSWQITPMGENESRIGIRPEIILVLNAPTHIMLEAIDDTTQLIITRIGYIPQTLVETLIVRYRDGSCLITQYFGKTTDNETLWEETPVVCIAPRTLSQMFPAMVRWFEDHL
jgi:hypothetical protein